MTGIPQIPAPQVTIAQIAQLHPVECVLKFLLGVMRRTTLVTPLVTTSGYALLTPPRLLDLLVVKMIAIAMPTFMGTQKAVHVLLAPIVVPLLFKMTILPLPLLIAHAQPTLMPRMVTTLSAAAHHVRTEAHLLEDPSR